MAVVQNSNHGAPDVLTRGHVSGKEPPEKRIERSKQPIQEPDPGHLGADVLQRMTVV